jgi:F-type H+-transporting ATPase subunit delta
LSRKSLEVLIRNHRINHLEAIVEALAAYVNAATNTVIAEVSSAHQLNGEEVESLRRTLEKKFAKRVDVRVKTDPTLLGGFVARVGSEIFDASISGKIEKFRDSLNQ